MEGAGREEERQTMIIMTTMLMTGSDQKQENGEASMLKAIDGQLQIILVSRGCVAGIN